MVSHVRTLSAIVTLSLYAPIQAPLGAPGQEAPQV